MSKRGRGGQVSNIYVHGRKRLRLPGRRATTRRLYALSTKSGDMTQTNALRGWEIRSVMEPGSRPRVTARLSVGSAQGQSVSVRAGRRGSLAGRLATEFFPPARAPGGRASTRPTLNRCRTEIGGMDEKGRRKKGIESLG